jgi:hypothetical protein
LIQPEIFQLFSGRARITTTFLVKLVNLIGSEEPTSEILNK